VAGFSTGVEVCCGAAGMGDDGLPALYSGIAKVSATGAVCAVVSVQ
jgi:hypothetical protein